MSIFVGAGITLMVSLRPRSHEFEFSGLSEAGNRRVVLDFATVFIHSLPERLVIASKMGVLWGSDKKEEFIEISPVPLTIP